MKHPLAWMALVTLTGCLSPSHFDSKFQTRFCEEWTACNPDWACELGEVDYSECDFDRKAAKACLDDEWVCDNSNTALPVVVPPESCTRAYVNCGSTGTNTGAATGTTGDTGTTTTSTP